MPELHNLIYISHGANPDDWFVVKPQGGSIKIAVQSLLAAGRTVYELDARAFARTREPVKIDRSEGKQA